MVMAGLLLFAMSTQIRPAIAFTTSSHLISSPRKSFASRPSLLPLSSSSSSPSSSSSSDTKSTLQDAIEDAIQEEEEANSNKKNADGDGEETVSLHHKSVQKRAGPLWSNTNISAVFNEDYVNEDDITKISAHRGNRPRKR
eukprot:scaffold1071_cov109-Cylindrotheca_fusiformis.AAC.1